MIINPPAFHHRWLLDDADVLARLEDAAQHVLTDFGVDDLAATELITAWPVPFGEELADVLHLEVEVVFVRLGTELHFFDFDHGALRAFFAFLLAVSHT